MSGTYEGFVEVIKRMIIKIFKEKIIEGSNPKF